VQWLAVGLSDDTRIVLRWVQDTKRILNHNWAKLTEPFSLAGVFKHLFFCATQACFEVRSCALPAFLTCAERLPTDALREMVREGMIGDIAAYSREFDDANAVRVLNFLLFLLTAGLEASFIQEVHADVMASALVPAVEEMTRSADPAVSLAASKFYNEFLDASRYLEEL
jgi:hypothetical protein